MRHCHLLQDHHGLTFPPWGIPPFAFAEYFNRQAIMFVNFQRLKVLDTFGNNIVKDQSSHLVYPNVCTKNNKSVNILIQLVIKVAKE